MYKVIGIRFKEYMDDVQSLFMDTNLGYCSCDKLTTEKREAVIATVLNHAKSKPKDKPLVLVTFGSGAMGIEYAITYYLKQAGFTDIQWKGVDFVYDTTPQEVSDKAEALKKYIDRVVDIDGHRTDRSPKDYKASTYVWPMIEALCEEALSTYMPIELMMSFNSTVMRQFSNLLDSKR